MVYIRSIILLSLFYLAITADISPVNVLFGLLVGLLVVVLLRPDVQPTGWRRWPGALVALVQYLAVMFVDLIVSGYQVARIVIDPSLPINPGIIAIPSNCQSDLSQALSAHAITVSPGEVVVEIDEEGVMYTHVLDVSRAEQAVEATQERRSRLLSRIFV